MRVFKAIPMMILLAVPATGSVMAADEKPHAYTREDLDRMFGPAPKSTTVPVDTSAQDWAYVQQFIEHQYARMDADREHALYYRDNESSRESDPWSYTGTALWYPGYGYGYGYTGGYRYRGWQSSSSVRGSRRNGVPHASPHDNFGQNIAGFQDYRFRGPGFRTNTGGSRGNTGGMHGTAGFRGQGSMSGHASGKR